MMEQSCGSLTMISEHKVLTVVSSTVLLTEHFQDGSEAVRQLELSESILQTKIS